MQDLRELSIKEAFRNLSTERQRVLLEELVIEAGQTEIKMIFESEEKARLFEFARKQWPLMSTKFFNQICERWNFLCEKSYGDDNISCCDVGDLFLHAKTLDGNKSYQDYPFHFDENRRKFFYEDVFKECKWEFMFIGALFPGNEWCTNYLIKDLMELSDEEYIAKMKEFYFI